jgi:hypothetical protein
MDIDFCGPAVPASDGGISYHVKVNGETVACHVSLEALQDINPSSYQSDPMAQFELHQHTLLSIAETKINNGQVKGAQVWVLTKDL